LTVLWRPLKPEVVYLHELRDGLQGKRVTDNWTGFYNAERPHSALDKRTPPFGGTLCHNWPMTFIPDPARRQRRQSSGFD
jgi:hypothetical protein